MIQDLSKAEINKAASLFPSLVGLNFIYQKKENHNLIFNFLDELTFENLLTQTDTSTTLKSIDRNSKLNKWNQELTFKILNLRNTFIYLSTFYDRYQSDKQAKSNQYFQYFVEIYSYFYISIFDNMLHIINIYFELDIKSKAVKLKHVVEKLNLSDFSTQECSKITVEFGKRTSYLRGEMRNLFAHHDNPFHFYLETSLNNYALNVAYKATIDNDQAYEEIVKGLTWLSEYIVSLRELLK